MRSSPHVDSICMAFLENIPSFEFFSFNLLKSFQEIEQHDAVVTDDDDDEDLVLHADFNLEKYQIDPIPDEDLDNIDELKINLDEKLKIEESNRC